MPYRDLVSTHPGYGEFSRYGLYSFGLHRKGPANPARFISVAPLLLLGSSDHRPVVTQRFHSRLYCGKQISVRSGLAGKHP